MDIGKGAVSQVKYFVKPMIGSPEIEGDLKPANLIKSGARSLTVEDFEKLAKIKTIQDKDDATRQMRELTGTMTWYNNNFVGNFMTWNRPNVNVRVAVLDNPKGYVLAKSLYTYYNIHKQHPEIPNVLRDHLFKNEWYRIASRGRYSTTYYTAFGARNVGPDRMGGLGDFYEGKANRIDAVNCDAGVRPVVQLINGVKLKESTRTGFDWEVVQ